MYFFETKEMSETPDTEPSVSPRVFRWFSVYNSWYLRRHFHALRLYNREVPPELPESPPLFYLNHPGWWDPLIALELINQYFPEYTHFTPMDASQLESFGFFRKLGVFPVKTGTLTGAKQFLRSSEDVLEREGSALWVTPQGQFADPRKRPIQFQPGLGTLVGRRNTGTVVPVAITYSFWTNRYPEVLIGFGDPVRIGDHPSRSPSDWTAVLEERLTSILDDLLEADRERDRYQFSTIMEGSSGIGGIYSVWMDVRARLFGSSESGENPGTSSEGTS